MNKTTFIYFLKDPRPGKFKGYIGKSNNPEKRYTKGHISAKALIGETKKINWLNKLKSLNLEPELLVLDEVPSNTKEEWGFWERHYISLFKSWGFELVNTTDGGEGNPCWQKHHKEETKNKIGLAHKGIKFTEEHKLKLSKAKGNTICSTNKLTGEIIEYSSLLQIKNKYGINYDLIKKHIKSQVLLDNCLLSYKDELKKINYPKNRTQLPKIQSRVYQINKNKQVVTIWNNAVQAFQGLFSKDTSDIGIFHVICRSKGHSSYKGFFYFYEEDLPYKAHEGDTINKLQIKTKEKEILGYKEEKLDSIFTSIAKAAQHFKVSETTIVNYIKQNKALNGYILKFKNL